MTAVAAKGERLTGLRVAHAATFLLICAAAIGVGVSEVQQLWFAWTHPFHFGEPPKPFAVLGAALGAGVGLTILVRFATQKRVPLWLSALACLSLLVGFFGQRGQGTPRRAYYAANLDVLAAGRQLHRLQTEALQTVGELQTARSDWTEALAKLSLPPSPARNRAFEKLPFELELLATKDARLTDLRPGVLAVWTSADGVEFSIFPIGFSEAGAAAPLVDDLGRPVELVGTFNPNLKEPKRPAVNLLGAPP